VKGTSHSCWTATGGPSSRQILGWQIQALAWLAVEQARGGGRPETDPVGHQARRRVGGDPRAITRPVPLVADHSKTASARGRGALARSGGSQGNQRCVIRALVRIHLSTGPWQVWGPPQPRFCPDADQARSSEASFGALRAAIGGAVLEPSWRWGGGGRGCLCSTNIGDGWRPTQSAPGARAGAVSHHRSFFAAALVVVAGLAGDPLRPGPWPVRFGPAAAKPAA